MRKKNTKPESDHAVDVQRVVRESDPYAWRDCSACQNSRYVLGPSGSHDCDCVRENHQRIAALSNDKLTPLPAAAGVERNQKEQND